MSMHQKTATCTLYCTIHCSDEYASKGCCPVLHVMFYPLQWCVHPAATECCSTLTSGQRWSVRGPTRRASASPPKTGTASPSFSSLWAPCVCVCVCVCCWYAVYSVIEHMCVLFVVSMPSGGLCFRCLFYVVGVCSLFVSVYFRLQTC